MADTLVERSPGKPPLPMSMSELQLLMPLESLIIRLIRMPL